MKKHMYHIKYSKKVIKFIASHPIQWEKIIQQAHHIAQSPYPLQPNVKRIVWVHDEFRIRIGDYRILYRVLKSKEIIFFFDAKSRWNAYKNRK